MRHYEYMAAPELAATLRRLSKSNPIDIRRLRKLHQVTFGWSMKHPFLVEGIKAFSGAFTSWEENPTPQQWSRVQAHLAALAKQFDRLGDEAPPPLR